MIRNEKKIFFQKYLKNPVSMGSITPSSRYLSREIARLVDDLEDTRIVELGPGTGAITHYIRPKRPTIVEIDRDMCTFLLKKFPNLEVVNSCALEFLRRIDYQCGIVLSIPLINNPLKEKIAAEVQRLYSEKILRWCVVYTYGLNNPLEEIRFKSANKHKTVFLNLPPAHIWHYR